MNFAKKQKPQAVVIGLDGVPFTLLNEMIQAGHLPNMSSIFSTGYFGQSSVCIPEISSVSWSSFMTGAQSGEHGIYGFMDFQPGTYKMYFPNFTHLKTSTLWDDLAKVDKKTVVLNMPATYPARQINGALVSGFVAIDINKAVYPSSLVPQLNNLDYRIDVDTMKAREDHDFLFQDLYATLDGRKKAAELLWNEIDWDLFIVVITGTDRLMHFLWEAYEQKDHAHHEAFLDYFNTVDQVVGQIYERFQELDGDNQLYMVSDHGFTAISTEVYLNRWLEEHGYLKYDKPQPQTIMDIGQGSAAFAMDPSRIYINTKNKYPHGYVDQNDYDKVRNEIRQGLESLTWQGETIAKKVFLKEELYHGPQFDHAPDLVVLSHHGFDLKGKVKTDVVFGRSNLVGMHSQDDAFFYSSTGAKCTSIFDAKKVILDPLMKG